MYDDDDTGHGPMNALNGVAGVWSNTFASKYSSWSWFQLEFPSEIEAIAGVEITKRAGRLYRFHWVEARIGNVAWTASSSSGLITANSECGRFPDADDTQVPAVILCNEIMGGKYMTLQQYQGNILEIDEIYVLGEL